MTTAVRERGEVAIAEAGKGVVLRLSNRDHKALQADHGKTWMMEFINDMGNGTVDIDMLEKIARLAAKDEKGEHVELKADAFDKMTIMEFGKKVMDALTMSVHGQTFKEFMEEQATKIKEAMEEGNIPPRQSPDMTTLTTSEESPSGQESESTSSGE